MGIRFLGLTTGPFRVPSKVSGDPVGTNPDIVLVEVMNPTHTDLEAEFFADFGTEPGSPLTHVFPSGVITFPADSLITLAVPVTFVPGQVVRVSMTGDVRRNGTLLEVEVIGIRSSDDMNEPTMFFRHHDLFPTNNITRPTLGGASSNGQWKFISK
ncbi:hypothetical protein [Neobacillus mesonae]|uniref:Uncharacterized protein n=1 Tax=Neobacillus mesonae TaxID=1193713 RepID=A0A3T0HZE2_9BACI|nr:hypothetical protein [Neobacillus mesonae]AZU62524.1 hypothetical protein CHR53_15255 [Neobacillus mesonae]